MVALHQRDVFYGLPPILTISVLTVSSRQGHLWSQMAGRVFAERTRKRREMSTMDETEGDPKLQEPFWRMRILLLEARALLDDILHAHEPGWKERRRHFLDESEEVLDL